MSLARIGRIQNGYAVAEHVADIKMPAVEHDLNTVGPSADIAVGQMTEAVSDALRRNGGLLRGGLAGSRRQSRKTDQAFPAIAPADFRHVLLRFSQTSLHGFAAEQGRKRLRCRPPGVETSLDAARMSAYAPSGALD